jgi:hypothetical protein
MGFEEKNYIVNYNSGTKLEVTCKNSFNRAVIDIRSHVKSFYEFLGLEMVFAGLVQNEILSYVIKDGNKLEGMVDFIPQNEKSFLVNFRKPYDEFLAYADVQKFLKNKHLFIQNS